RGLLAGSVSRVPEPSAPMAARKPIERVHHGDTFVDDYEWLRDKSDPEVIAYLRAENEYAESCTAHLQPLQDDIFAEISARTKQTDLSVPYRRGRYWYYSRTVEGQQYQIHCRVPIVDDEPPAVDAGEIDGEEIILDGNLVAGDSAFFALGTVDVSPDGRYLAYSVDLSGDERFTLRIRDLASGEDLPDEIPGVFYNSAWSADNSVLFYLTVDETWRPDRAWRHVLGTAAQEDVVVLSEPDERFWIDVALSRNERAIQISLASTMTSEVWLIDSARPLSEPVVVAARRDGVEYSVEHAGDQLLIVHNDGAENFALASAPLDETGHQNWRTLIPGSDTRRLVSVDAFAEHVVLFERAEGLTQLSIMPRRDLDFGAPVAIEFDEPLFTVSPGNNADWDATSYRLRYSSLVTPDTVYDYDVASGSLLLRKRQPVLGDVDLSAYRQHREWATATDGTKIPLSIVSRANVTPNGDAPVVLYGYGAYEHSIDPIFAIDRLSLLDRGVVYVIAHIRGGGEMGRRWYEEGKLQAKRNTFTDFIAAADHLVTTGWTRPKRIVALGGSAGGLLMGAVANLAPEKFGGILARVPFVDPLTSVLDPSLPLTVIEWEEWGNPLADAEAYAYLKSYSPYENVRDTAYPPILAQTSLNDTRVLFVEPAKWIAKLRATVVDSSRMLLMTEMDAGHGGRSGRYDAWRESAFRFAWALDTLGIA
ncbi:MAG: oligopeptidase, partial [Pseudonocardiales bacterium]|nr:oligopeptidase [Pseudonocardiales bacterium]